ncbi:MAG: AbrB/MazE/SpoVT family DNA-binding domain-containing protein, partial [Candidatus Binataceae bacterium]
MRDLFPSTLSATPTTGIGQAMSSSGGNGLIAPVHYRGNVSHMSIARSKVTAQGQISVPAEVRRKLGVGPGSVLEWDEQGHQVVVRRAGQYSSE